MQAMVTEAAQTEATYHAGIALVRAYMGLRNEMSLILEGEGLESLREESDRLFPSLPEPEPFKIGFDPINSQAKLLAAANEALINLRQLGGWIQGLINELTLEQRMRLDAEERAKLQSRPATGFVLGS
jgi:hypothetical protein